MTSLELPENRDSHELVNLRNTLQERLMEIMRPDGEDRTKNGLEWIEIFAQEFEQLFERKRSDDPNFIESCKTEGGLNFAVKWFELALIVYSASKEEEFRKSA